MPRGGFLLFPANGGALGVRREGVKREGVKRERALRLAAAAAMIGVPGPGQGH